jgi:hypothetical protein
VIALRIEVAEVAGWLVADGRARAEPGAMRSPMRKRSVGLRVDAELQNRLVAVMTVRSRAEARTVTVSEVLRRLVDLGLPREEARLAEQAAAAAGAARGRRRAPRTERTGDRGKGATQERARRPR